MIAYEIETMINSGNRKEFFESLNEAAEKLGLEVGQEEWGYNGNGKRTIFIDILKDGDKIFEVNAVYDKDEDCYYSIEIL